MDLARTSQALLCVAALLVLVALPTSARASQTKSIVLTPEELRDARDFWTAERMRRARPLSPPRMTRAPRLTRSSGHRGGGGIPHRYPPRAPLAPALSSSVFEAVPDPTLPGIAQNGAIFIVIGPGQVGRCSGTSINAPNRSVVFTAGHCVHDFFGWLRPQWVFVPGYHHGLRPFGTFVARWLGSTPRWVNSGNQNFDVGAAVVSRNERGETLGEAVGGAGIAWNLSPNQVFDVYGYPAGEPFNGATLQRCPQTPFQGHDLSSFLVPGPLNLAVECNVTGGASGGGWFISGNLLNGITTNGYPEDPTTDYGPYFGKAVGRLFRAAARVK